MLDITKDIQGVALYAQWKKPGNMLQVLVTPDGYGTDPDSRLVSASIFRRVTSIYQPKRQWRGTSLTGLNSDWWLDPDRPVIKDKPFDPRTPNVVRETQVEVANGRTLAISRVLDTIPDQEWELAGELLFIETSKKDIDDIAVDKTPSKLMYRVNQLRELKGMPMAPESL